MSFANPLLLYALAGLAVPVLVHLAQAREREGRAFPSLMFLRRVPFRTRRRLRIRDPLLLFLRCLALVALVLAFAVPLLALDTGATQAPSRDAVVLLDRSYSMGAGGRFEDARRRAAEYIDALPGDARVGALAFDSQVETLQVVERDAAAARRALDAARIGDGGTRIVAAVDAAVRLLQAAPTPHAEVRTVALVSDLQRSAVDAVERLVLPAGVELEVLAAEARPVANLALLGAALERDASSPGAARELAVRVANTGAEAVPARRLSIDVDGRPARPQEVPALEPGAVHVARLPLSLASDRETRVRLALDADALAADDMLEVVLAPRRRLRVLLVAPANDGALRSVYLRSALSLDSDMSVRTTRAGALDSTALADADVVVLNDAWPISPQALDAFVQAGGGVLLAAGDALARSWPSAVGWLPAVGAPVLESAPSRLRLATSDRVFDGLGAALGDVRVQRWHSLVARPDDSVLARLDDGTPAIIERRAGAGRVAVVGSGADARGSSLALSPGFVPLAQALVRRVAAARDVSGAGTVEVGEVMDLASYTAAFPDAAGWRRHFASAAATLVELPGGSERRLDAGATLFVADRPGIYELHRGERPVAFAANVGRAESRLAAATPDALLARRVVRDSREPREPAPVSNTRHEGQPPWTRWLLFIGLALLLGEALLGNRTRPPARPGESTA